MGYGVFGMVAWAQKFYLLSQLNVFHLPAPFQQLGESFKWSMLNFGCVPSILSHGDMSPDSALDMVAHPDAEPLDALERPSACNLLLRKAKSGSDGCELHEAAGLRSIGCCLLTAAWGPQPPAGSHPWCRPAGRIVSWMHRDFP